MRQVLPVRHKLSACHYICFNSHPDEVFPVGRDVRAGKAKLATYLYHTDAGPLVLHHFTSLLTGCTVTTAPRNSAHAPLGKRPPQPVWCFSARGERQTWTLRQMFFPLISRMARIDFSGHTGESHFRLGLIRHFNLLQLSSTNSKKVIDFCIINNSGDYD